MLAGLKETINKVDELEVRVDSLEDLVSNYGSSTTIVLDEPGLFGRMVVWLTDKILYVKSLIVNDKICVGETCVDENTLKALLENAGQVATTTPNSISEVELPSEVSTSTPQDTTPPTITLQGNNPATVSIGAEYHDLGVTITDNMDSNLGYEVWRNGEYLDRNLTGVSVDTQPQLSDAGGQASTTIHTISYVAQDQAGNVATSTRTIIVSVGGPTSLTEETATTTPTE